MEINYKEGVVWEGNPRRLKRIIEKAGRGESVTLGFIGGSITQGFISSIPETCYAYLIYLWWRKRFPESLITYKNAGIGATDSHFAVARAEDDLLIYQPDVVFVEFSVNDGNTLFFRETYEGLIRRILAKENAPAVVLLHNVFYETGTNAQDQHSVIGRYYDLPCLSMKSLLYQAVAEGRLPVSDITPDDLHPNDYGHKILAGMVIDYLESVTAKELLCDDSLILPPPTTKNAYEQAVRYQNNTAKEIVDKNTGEITTAISRQDPLDLNAAHVTCDGFIPDKQPQQGITDIFRRGWYADQMGAGLHIEVYAREIALQYRKTIRHPACCATAVLDGDTKHPILLDGNFGETWGDFLCLETILHHGEYKKHTIDIRITQAPEKGTPFYLVSIICAS
jgi:lysophospholipase L1-like esterase